MENETSSQTSSVVTTDLQLDFDNHTREESYCSEERSCGTWNNFSDPACADNPSWSQATTVVLNFDECENEEIVPLFILRNDFS